MSNEIFAPTARLHDQQLGCPECGSSVDGAVLCCRYCGELQPDLSDFPDPGFALSPPEVIEGAIIFPATQLRRA